MRLPAVSLVVLVGPSGAGKTQWAAANFAPGQIVSSDALRALVGTGERDQRSSGDAFAVLDLVVERRLARGLLTVIDTLGLDPQRRAGYVALARRFGVPCHAVVFDTAPEVCRTRNRQRADPVPAKVLSAQLAARDRARTELAGEGFAAVHPAEAVVVVPPVFVDAPRSAARQHADPRPLRFGLQLSSFAWDGGGPALADRLAEVAATAEAVGFSSIWVMDHMTQIPQVGRIWEDLPESWTTVAWLAGHTRSVRLGTLVTGVTLRHLAHLAKIVATADVLSRGRVICGLGAAWWAEEHRRHGRRFPSLDERYALLEDALRLLPLMWGPGTPEFTGTTLTVPEAVCYPRPVQERVPLLVGGSGEHRTLRLVARLADACNLFGDPPEVRHKLAALARHCADAGRPLDDIRVTHLSTAVTATSRRQLSAVVDRLAPASGRTPPATRLGAATVEDQIGRYRDLADAGVQTAIVALPDVATPGVLEAFAEVIAAFAPPSGRPGPAPPW
jgi:alkanesulfonate monooxygenase SsuD/methylene tetrahydromethanopterin reductase-like flavin-dependent oxidoreductase (luciferase family)/predicted kinase